MDGFRKRIVRGLGRLARRVAVVLAPALAFNLLLIVYVDVLVGDGEAGRGAAPLRIGVFSWSDTANAYATGLGLGAVVWCASAAIGRIAAASGKSFDRPPIMSDREAWKLLAICVGGGFWFWAIVHLPLRLSRMHIGGLLLFPIELMFGMGFWGWVALRGFRSLRSARSICAVLLLNVASMQGSMPMCAGLVLMPTFDPSHYSR